MGAISGPFTLIAYIYEFAAWFGFQSTAEHDVFSDTLIPHLHTGGYGGLFCGCWKAESGCRLSRSEALIAGGHYLNHPPPPLDSGAKCGCDNDEGVRGSEGGSGRQRGGTERSGDEV